MWVHKYPLLVTKDNVLAYARFLYGSLPFDVGTVRLVSATEPMAEWERELLDQQECVLRVMFFLNEQVGSLMNSPPTE